MKSKLGNFAFFSWGNKDIASRFTLRDGERKLGEDILVANKPTYVIIGIAESIGPLANQGRSGAELGFEAFCSRFLAMQSNESLNGNSIAIAGKVNFIGQLEDILDFREVVSELDEFLLAVLQKYVMEDQFPIIIGGGHNNAYSLIQFSSQRFKEALQVVNLDPHADYRAFEGRHSGNSFSYAYECGYIERYAVLGLHQRYNSRFILSQLDLHQHIYSFYEDYLDGNNDLFLDVKKILDVFRGKHIGIELDMDAIAFMPSSACSPSGFQLDVARKYIRTLAQYNKIAYLHLPEAAPQTDQEGMIVGKALAYLVTDFIQLHSNK